MACSAAEMACGAAKWCVVQQKQLTVHALVNMSQGAAGTVCDAANMAHGAANMVCCTATLTTFSSFLTKVIRDFGKKSFFCYKMVQIEDI